MFDLDWELRHNNWLLFRARNRMMRVKQEKDWGFIGDFLIKKDARLIYRLEHQQQRLLKRLPL